MKLSVWSSYYIDLSPEDMVLEFEKHGFRYSELSDEHSVVLMERGDVREVGERFRAFSEEHGVRFPQGHLLLHARICDGRWTEPLKKHLDLFRAVGVKNAVLHPDWMPRNTELTREERVRRNGEAVRELADYVRDSGMVICVENGGSAEDLLSILREADRPNVGICLDTGHLNLHEDRSQKEFIRTAGKHIKALHIADNEGERDQHIMPFGQGTVDVTEVLTEMRKLGYEGLYNLEIPGERKAPLEIRSYKLEYLKKMFAYLEEQTKP